MTAIFTPHLAQAVMFTGRRVYSSRTKREVDSELAYHPIRSVHVPGVKSDAASVSLQGDGGSFSVPIRERHKRVP